MGLEYNIDPKIKAIQVGKYSSPMEHLGKVG